jgi:hypothetical protein
VVQFRFVMKHIAGAAQAAEIVPSGIQELGKERRTTPLRERFWGFPMRLLPEDVGTYRVLTIESHIFASLRRRSLLTAECFHAQARQGVDWFAGSLA